ncbi:MAG TPA: HEAT repeat domain-containing protein [Candidatus Eisenbacteria bacterium]|nr:HEAT repeat domain-containing protein [Candidatus Eisenbacteria bacterium]
MAGDTRQSARAFVRSLNILLKFARLYEFGHVRTMAQFETAWKELRAALDESGETGLLLGASGNQILLDGVPLGAAAAEKSFAQLLITSGIASIHFAPNLTQPQFARFVRAFPSGNAKPSSLAEQLKTALAGDPSIRINEIRFVAEDGSVAGIKMAAQLTSRVLGAQGDKLRDVFEDPQKLLQLILAAESNRGGSGGGGGGLGFGPGGGGGGGTGGGSGASWSGGTGGGGSLWEAGKPGTATGAGGTGGGTGAGGGPGGGGPGFGPGSGGPGGGGGIGGGGTGTGSGGDGSGGPGTGVGSGPGGGNGPGVGGPGSGGPGGGGSGSGGPGGGTGGVGGGASEPGKWQSATAMFKGGVLGGVPGMPGGVGSGAGGGYGVAEDDIRSMIGLFAQLGKARKDPEARMDAGAFQSRLSTLPVRAQVTLQQALAGLAAQAPNDKPDKPMLLKLAEHVAIRFALDSYERGELRVNAVKQLLDRMNAEIEALRKILGQQEETMASAGLQVHSYTELLDQEFWLQVPEENKKEVLTSEEAWCVPPHNVRGFLEEMLRRGELKTVNEILTKYAACVGLEAPEARRTTAIGLSDLAEFYGSGDGSQLIDVIQRLGNQLSVEREPDLQTLVGAAFVRMSQEASAKRFYPAMQQAMASLDSVEALRPGSTNNLRQRIGAEERVPEFVEDSMRTGHVPDGLLDILALMPKTALNYITNRFANCGFREDCELLGEMVRGLGEEATSRLVETLQTAPASEATEVIGLLSQLTPETVERLLPTRLAQWPRASHDRAVRQLSSTPAEQRALLLVSIYVSLDPLIRPLAIDEMGMSGRTECIPVLLDLIRDDSTPGFVRIKAIEAAGRLRASAASPLLQQLLEAKQVWRWAFHTELRIAAAQALQKVEPTLAIEKIMASGLDRKELVLEPTDPEANASVIRQRRYARLKLSKHVPAVTSNLRENMRISIAELNMGGGIGASDRHLAPGSLLALKISHGVRNIRAQAIVRGARPQAMAFEFVDVELDERSRLRKMLLELGGLPQPSNVSNRTRRQSRVAILK